MKITYERQTRMTVAAVERARAARCQRRRRRVRNRCEQKSRSRARARKCRVASVCERAECKDDSQRASPTVDEATSAVFQRQTLTFFAVISEQIDLARSQSFFYRKKACLLIEKRLHTDDPCK